MKCKDLSRTTSSMYVYFRYSFHITATYTLYSINSKFHSFRPILSPHIHTNRYSHIVYVYIKNYFNKGLRKSTHASTCSKHVSR